DIEADAAAGIKLGIEAEVIERGCELHPAARYVRVRRLGAQHRVGGNFLRRLRDDNVVGGHAAGGDGGLRLGAALEQAALDQQPIDANAASHACTISGRMSGTPAEWCAAEWHVGVLAPHAPDGTNNGVGLLFPAGSL